MKIGIIINQYPAHSETFIQSFLDHFHNHNVTILARFTAVPVINKNWSFKPYLNRAPHTRLLFQYIKTLFGILIYFNRLLVLKQRGIPLKQLIADAGIWTTPSLDILHFPFANSAFGREHYAAVLGAKMTLSFRGSDLNVYPVFHKITYARLWPYVQKVHCNSAELAEKLREHDKPEQIPVVIIPPALRNDLQTVMPSIMVKDRIGTTENPLSIVTLGRLHWVKDYPLALRTIAILKQKGITLNYHILGEGVEREQLMFLIHELGLTKQVKLHGRSGTSEINQIFKMAHIYLQTSLAEGFSNACMEAQAFGLPCIVPGISGMRACVEDGKTGIIVINRNENAFAEAIMNVVQHIQNFDAEYASRRIKKQFSLDRQKLAWLNFFEDLIA
jgi:colanic acid/amylovoran biosynthesis glycosyltransferase